MSDNYIRITKRKGSVNFTVSSPHTALQTNENEYVTAKIEYDSISIERVGSTHEGTKMYSVSKTTSPRSFAITDNENILKPGKYKIDEDESNADRVVSYFEE